MDSDVEVIVPVENPFYPGYFVVPGLPVFAISPNGDVINVRTGGAPKKSFNYKGYPIVTINLGVRDGTLSKMIHRLLALTFIGRPKRHIDKDFSELNVNHIDGDKTNYALSNLEWVTASENTSHAYDVGLINCKRVLCKNILTGHISSYRSCEEAARAFEIPYTSLRRYMRCPNTRHLTKDWTIFKYDDGSEWVTLSPEQIKAKTMPGCLGFWLFENVENGKCYFDHRASRLVEALKLKPALATKVKYYAKRKVPSEGYFIHYFDTREDLDVYLNLKKKALK